MSAPASPDQPSPWRRIFEDVRRAVGNKRDENGVLGSINWLRKQMEERGANPNVVRNIIYRDKGKLSDKRVLFEILSGLWEGAGQPPLRAPELEVLLSPGSNAEQEVLQLLGREKRRAYRAFVGGVRNGGAPKLLVTGRPGSGKTLLLDYIQQALEAAPRAEARIVRLELTSPDLAAGLSRLAAALGVPAELFEAKLVKIGASGAFAVQADAQADVARVLLDAARAGPEPLVLMLHVSQVLANQEHLGAAPLRLNTPQVPRVGATEWLWSSLFEPLSRLPDASLLVSMSDVPARALASMGRFEGPVKLSPPTIGEARRFVKARLPHLAAAQQETVVQRAGRSFEELRTLTLLAEIRAPARSDGGRDASGAGVEAQGLLPPPAPGSRAALAAGGDGPGGADGAPAEARHIEQLGTLVRGAGDPRLREFLAALAVLSLPEFPVFREDALRALRDPAHAETAGLEMAFLDPVPGQGDAFRCFSRQLARTLRERLRDADAPRYRELNRLAAAHYRAAAEDDPKGEAASRYLHHLFEARDWAELEAWLRRASIQGSLVRRLWSAAEAELGPDRPPAFERIALQVAAHYVKLGSYEHPDALRAFDALAASSDPDLRAWTVLKRAEGAVLKGHFDRAETLLEDGFGAPGAAPGPARLRVEAALVRASVARWRSDLDEAARLVSEEARALLVDVDEEDPDGHLVHAKVAVWAGLIAKDDGRFEDALREFGAVPPGDDLIEARVAFQRGDALLALGRFDAALRELDRAAALAHRSEALVQEQARYLARRGVLRLRSGDLDGAEEDFAAARAAASDLGADAPVGIERAFLLAKIDDEHAPLLLARGRADEAIGAIRHELDVFRRYAEAFGVDAGYRTRRAVLGLAVAYAERAGGVAAADVRPAPADLEHARALIRETLAELEAHPDRRHLRSLLRRAREAAAAYASDAAEARRHAEAALADAEGAYPRARARAALAAALLRAGDAAGALAAAEAGARDLDASRGGPGPAGPAEVDPQERGDLRLRAALDAVAMRALVARGDGVAAAERLAARLAAARRPQREGGRPPGARVLDALDMLRAFGEALEARGEALPDAPALREALALHRPLDASRVRLPDALVGRWLELLPAGPHDGGGGSGGGDPDARPADGPPAPAEATPVP